MTETYIDTVTKLEAFRLSKGFSYRELAMYLGMDHTLVYRFCRKQRIPNEKWRQYLYVKAKIPVIYWKRYD